MHVGTQRGADREFADGGLLDRHRQGPGVQHADQLFDFFFGEPALNDAVLADRLVNLGRRMNFVVEHHGQLPLRAVFTRLVQRRQFVKPVPAGLAEVESDRGRAVAVALRVRALEQLAGDLLALVRFVQNQDLFVSLGFADHLAHGNFRISIESRVGTFASLGILFGR